MTEIEGRVKVSVVIPVFNEATTIRTLLQRVQEIDVEKEIIIVDDGSNDDTPEFLRDLEKATKLTPPVMTGSQGTYQLRAENIRVLFQEKNMGKGAALRRGFQEAQGQIILVQDADLEYDPKDYFRLLEPIQKGVADVVYGSRFLEKNQRVLGRLGYLGNKIFTSLSNWATHQKLTDVWTGYKVFKREVLQSMALIENGFGFEPEVTAKVGKEGWRICEVPISYSRRTRPEGKKITWKDGIKALYCILRYK